MYACVRCMSTIFLLNTFFCRIVHNVFFCCVICQALPGSMGGTYGGNAVSCAAALGVLDAFEHDGVLANVQERSQELFAVCRVLLLHMLC